jgi:hypothetical protein
MAESTLNLVKVTKEVTVTEPRLTLVLSEKEAKVLAAILGSVGGDSNSSNRSVSDRITRALSSSGYTYGMDGIHVDGILTFPNFKKESL